MKLLVISDTHGFASAIDAAIRAEAPDALIHLGDFESDLKMSGLKSGLSACYSVPGNCDGVFGGAAAEICFDFCGVRIFALHGHTRGMHASVDGGVSAAREAGASVLLFGHTHVPLLSPLPGLTVMNPGSARRGRRGAATYGTLEVNGEGVFGNIRTITSEMLFTGRG